MLARCSSPEPQLLCFGLFFDALASRGAINTGPKAARDAKPLRPNAWTRQSSREEGTRLSFGTSCALVKRPRRGAAQAPRDVAEAFSG